MMLNRGKFYKKINSSSIKGRNPFTKISAYFHFGAVSRKKGFYILWRILLYLMEGKNERPIR